MSQRQIPGGPFVDESGTAQRQIPGGPFLDETGGTTTGLTLTQTDAIVLAGVLALSGDLTITSPPIPTLSAATVVSIGATYATPRVTITFPA